MLPGAPLAGSLITAQMIPLPFSVPLADSVMVLSANGWAPFGLGPSHSVPCEKAVQTLLTATLSGADAFAQALPSPLVKRLTLIL
jgi:hypothetical protein